MTTSSDILNCIALVASHDLMDDERFSMFLYTNLYAAITKTKGFKEVLDTIIDNAGGRKLTITDENSCSVMVSAAISNGSVKVLEFLSKNGCELFFPEEKPLEMAVESGIEMFKYVYENITEINDDILCDAFVKAIWSMDYEIVDFLIATIGNPNFAFTRGTLLSICCKQMPRKENRKKFISNIVEMLLLFGADPNLLVDSQQETPLTVVKKFPGGFYNEKLVLILEEHGAK